MLHDKSWVHHTQGIQTHEKQTQTYYSHQHISQAQVTRKIRSVVVHYKGTKKSNTPTQPRHTPLTKKRRRTEINSQRKKETHTEVSQREKRSFVRCRNTKASPQYIVEIRVGNPKAGSLKTVPLRFLELCAELFDGNAATGMHKWTSTQQTSLNASSSHCRPKPLLLQDTVLHEIEDDVTDTGHQTFESTPEPTPEPNPDRTSEHTPEHNPEPNPKKKTKISKSTINSDELARDMQEAIRCLIKGKEGPTVVECSEKLKLVGLNPIDPLFLAAYHIFGVSLDMRAAWMTLPEIPEVLKGWITMTARSLELINE
ncbi:unnamed protein product [Cuscuta campestris]|uniref:Uncharacterized protein n=1 Tax=Cuscuta campestris TaxID=132261 RepID=A0A484MIW3_9ASTE|nr:unnamed protein product [Cuscuta campestris]